MKPKALTEPEFDEWIQARDLSSLARLSGESEQDFRRWLWDRLRGAIIIAVSRSSFSSTGSEGPYGLSVVPKQAWAEWNYNDPDFWKFGTLDYEYSTSATGMYGGMLKMTFIDVRFDPEMLKSSPSHPPLSPVAEAIISPSDPSGKVRRQDLPVVPEPIVQAWAEWYRNQAGATQDGAIKSAAQMFPNHNLARDRVRELFNERPPGRPLKSKT